MQWLCCRPIKKPTRVGCFIGGDGGIARLLTTLRCSQPRPSARCAEGATSSTLARPDRTLTRFLTLPSRPIKKPTRVGCFIGGDGDIHIFININYL